MDYKKIYDCLITRAKSRNLVEYTEKHHILPRSLGGSDNKNNIVKLTPEEHYLAHQLLVRITNNDPRMVKAAVMMCRNRPSNKLYGWLRRRLANSKSAEMKGTGNTMFNKRWVSNEHGSKLVAKTVADDMIHSGYYISGKKAVRATCGCLVANRCATHENKLANTRARIRDEFIKKTKELFDEFINSEVQSVTKFANLKNTSQPALTKVWKKYIPEYSEYVKHGKSFKKGLNKD
jgi:hypothetical protein